MILVKEVLKGDKRGYAKREVEKVIVHSNLNGVVYEFSQKIHLKSGQTS